MDAGGQAEELGANRHADEDGACGHAGLGASSHGLCRNSMLDEDIREEATRDASACSYRSGGCAEERRSWRSISPRSVPCREAAAPDANGPSSEGARRLSDGDMGSVVTRGDWAKEGRDDMSEASYVQEMINYLLVRQRVAGDSTVFNPKSLAFSCSPEPKLNAWFPDRVDFWRTEGSILAWRNLIVSQLNLMLAFAVWLMWSILVVRIQKAHDADETRFRFDHLASDSCAYKSRLYLLPALAGLSGGTFRITNSFMIMPVGGRVTITMTTSLLILPCVVAAWELSRPDPTLWVLAIAAMLSGIGGGAFASSMSNISYFFPGRIMGLALGLNGGVGNLGVSLTQLMIPIIIAGAGSIIMEEGGDTSSGGDAADGRPDDRVWVGSIFWVPFCLAAALSARQWLNDMPHHGNESLANRIWCYISMEGAACVASAVASSIFFATASSLGTSPNGQLGQIFLMTLVAIVLAHIILYFVVPSADLRSQMRSQLVIFRSPHTYVMSWLYIVCFGTFIGFSSSFPKLILDVFGYIDCKDGSDTLGAKSCSTSSCPNPKAPKVGFYAFLGPLLGAVVRPFGGWMSDRMGGAIVTQVYIGIMTVTAIGIGIVERKARSSDHPEEWFNPFLALFLVLFATSGMSNGSTFKQISQVFRAQGVGELVGPVLGWSSALASFGAFIIPSILSIATHQNQLDVYMYGFAAYYLFCFFLNFWFYLRPDDGKGKCPRPVVHCCQYFFGAVMCSLCINTFSMCVGGRALFRLCVRVSDARALEQVLTCINTRTGAVSVIEWMNTESNVCSQCGGVKPQPRSESNSSDPTKGGAKDRRKNPLQHSLNHLDAEPCICDIIKDFRGETGGREMWYQGKLWAGAVPGTATPLTDRRQEKISGWLAGAKDPNAPRSMTRSKGGAAQSQAFSGSNFSIKSLESADGVSKTSDVERAGAGWGRDKADEEGAEGRTVKRKDRLASWASGWWSGSWRSKKPLPKSGARSRDTGTTTTTTSGSATAVAVGWGQRPPSPDVSKDERDSSVSACDAMEHAAASVQQHDRLDGCGQSSLSGENSQVYGLVHFLCDLKGGGTRPLEVVPEQSPGLDEHAEQMEPESTPGQPCRDSPLIYPV